MSPPSFSWARDAAQQTQRWGGETQRELWVLMASQTVRGRNDTVTGSQATGIACGLLRSAPQEDTSISFPTVTFGDFSEHIFL